MAFDGIFPFTVPIGSLLVSTGIVKVPINSDMTIQDVSGSLRGISVGTFTVEVRALPRNALVSSLSWTAPGTQRARNPNFRVSAEEILSFDITSLGTGALDCLLTIWWQV